jgi:hypothetical protein
VPRSTKIRLQPRHFGPLASTLCISFHEDAENEQQLHNLTNDRLVLNDDALK